MNDLQLVVKDHLNRWEGSRTPAHIRNSLLALMREHGHVNLGDFIFLVATQPIVGAHYHDTKTEGAARRDLGDPAPAVLAPSTTPLRDFAKKIWDEGYRGEYMRDQADACRWILSMAEGLQDETDLNEAGTNFWKAARSKYGLWATDKLLVNGGSHHDKR